jgi:molybdopterin molybdotransferase
MISVQEALDLVVANAGRQEVERELTGKRLGRTLAEDVIADADSPPFDKSMMDGFAVRAEDVAPGRALRVVGEIRAGTDERPVISNGETAAIMTGAAIPPGADAVIVVERCRVPDGVMTTDLESCKPGANILARGEEYRQGQIVLKAGRLVGPGEMAVLASVGQIWSKVYKQPEVGVIATGDELVFYGEDSPPPGKIRNTNSPTVESLLHVAGADQFIFDVISHDLDPDAPPSTPPWSAANLKVPSGLESTPDDLESLRHRIRNGLESDLLILTGGVSMGKADFVPQVLADLGVKQVFHKVALKPGMPVWFGTHEKGLVFGLPGNPVSVLVCFELFVTTALRARQGWADPLPRFFNAKLKADFNYPTKRETYHPAILTFTDDGPAVAPVPWFGSADVLGASRADALVVLPVGAGEHKTGDRLRVLPLSKPGWVWTCSGAGGAS